MRKILSFLLIVILLFSLCACSNSENNPTDGINNNNIETNETNTKDVIIEQFIDGTFENKITLRIPEKFNDKYVQKVSSSFSDGYYSITICVKDTNFDLFTIYCSKNDKYKEFEKEKGYEILKQDKGYTCVWYEYGYTATDGSKLPQILEDFKIEYKAIKTSFTIE